MSSKPPPMEHMGLALLLYWSWPLWLIPLIRYRAASRGACAASVGIGIVAFVLGFPIA